MHFDIHDGRLVRRAASRAFMRLPVLLAVLSLAVGLPLHAQDIPLPSPQPNDTISRNIGTVRAGDLLAVVVFQHPELSGTYPIDPNGYVNIAGIGSFRVAGLAPSELKARFAREMAPRILNPEFTVLVQIRVFVIGEVARAGLHPVEPGTTLLQMLAIAGGPTALADLRHTSVIRDNRRFQVDLESGLAGSAAGSVVLFSNDQVIVDRKRGLLTRENITFLLGGVTAILTLANIIISLQGNP
jgi:polysaccharide biosynthesis/export protein